MKKLARTQKTVRTAGKTPAEEETYNAECLLAKVIAKLAFNAQSEPDPRKDDFDSQQEGRTTAKSAKSSSRKKNK